MRQPRAAITVALLGLVLQPIHAQQTSPTPKSGYRGMSLIFDSDRAFYLSPDDVVDVIAVMQKPKGTSATEEETIAATLLKRVRVLAVKPSETSPGKSVVHLQLNPNEAQYLEVAAHQGNIWLSWRAKGDVEDHPMVLAAWRKYLKTDFQALSSSRPPQSGRVPAGNSSASPALLAAVASRMRESYPALNVPIASDKALFIQPGDRIDVLATIDAKRPKGPKTGGVSMTILQNILVVDNRRSQSHPGQNILLLAMNYDEVQYAALAWDTAEIQILSREKTDTDIHPIQPASLDRLW